jgi:transposase-like protein
MARYSMERKEAVLKKLLPPNNRTVISVAAEEGISDQTLYNWLKHKRYEGAPVPGKNRPGNEWSAEAKFAVVVETAGMSAEEINQYCREKGLYPAQIETWRAACLTGPSVAEKHNKEEKRQSMADRKKIKKLQAEIRRKDRALAEAAALLVLSKKLDALYGIDQDEDD